MCNVGDIILVESYKYNKSVLTRHSFVVLTVGAESIERLDYDFVCNVLSSFKNEQQRTRKLRYPGNFEITHEDSTVVGGNTKDGYIKAEQLYYFNSKKTKYTVIGKLNQNVFEKLLDFIENLKVPLEEITTNL